MKTNIYFSKLAIVICALLLCTSCKDFFSNVSPSAESADKVFSDASLTEQAICGAYQELAKDKGYTNRLACGYVGLNTDCEWSTWATGTDDRSKFVTYDIPGNSTAIANRNGSDSWAYLGTVIERCNNIIEGISQYGDTTQVVFRYYLGEAYLLRSFAYLEMVKYWGDVPARFVSLTTDPDGVNARKADRNIIFDHLRIDLKEAARLMPWSNDSDVPTPCRNKVGRGSKAAALALLARADLMYAGKAVRPTTLDAPADYSVRANFEDDALRQEIYEEVMWACAQIIKQEDYKLAADFITPFKQLCADVSDYDQMEHIWTIPFADGARGQVMGFNAPKIGSSYIDALSGKLPGVGLGAKSNGHLCITPYLLYQFDKDDARRAVTCVQGQWVYDNSSVNGLPSGLKVYQNAINAKNFYLGKFRFEWMAAGRTSTGDDGVDFPLLRYADVLLMFAEASIGSNMGVTPTNNTGLDPLEQLNKVRRRANLPDASTLDFEAIKTERAKELCGEYVRKYDLMRWGILKEEVLKAETFCRSLIENDDVATIDLNGKSVSISSKYWYKLKQDATLNDAWAIDSIYGLVAGETEKPEFFSKDNGWIEKKNIFGSDDKGWDMAKSSYPFYHEAEQLESRQYWPIFEHYITASNGNLWNNYGY